MNTYHIHIGGLVQGVGFRPYVCQLAQSLGITGWVSNGNDGITINCTTTKKKADQFYTTLVNDPPANAIIRSHHFIEIAPASFPYFSIHQSDTSAKPDLLLTPDIAICSHCLEEINDTTNIRHQYPFITCLHCGPRYSISTGVPYDRHNTTMSELDMCQHCQAEYNDIYDQRHYSQTNSCPDCSIPIHLFTNQGVELCNDTTAVVAMVQTALKDGLIVAVKGVGGYLLLCDATKKLSITKLRERKQRPAKPFAVLYPSVESIEMDVVLKEEEKNAVTGKTAPIVLCQLKKEVTSGICIDSIAPGLDKLGVMLPYTGLLAIIAQNFRKPLIATSGNTSGSPIIYTDDDALLWLSEQADLILSFERDIVAPQDDSVLQFTTNYHQPILLRRSRGLAPNYYPSPFFTDNCILAMGAELKSAFAIQYNENLYVSQFLGDQGNYDAQICYKNTLYHLLNLLDIKPDKILIDSHPEYSVSETGKYLADEFSIPYLPIQHHKAHFSAVLAENKLLTAKEGVLGVVWDGTGYGDDGNIWGGEFFIFEDGTIERYKHLAYFPLLQGDKMSKEPRISAVSMLRKNIDQLMSIKGLFSIAEREYYLKLLQQNQPLQTSSAGRLLDGIAAILLDHAFNTYEGEAAMKLEAVARSCDNHSMAYFPITITKTEIAWSEMVDSILTEKTNGILVEQIARKVFVSMAMLIKEVATRSGVKKIAFSGGVFQNSFLVDLIIELLQDEFSLYFHQQLSPNDECISFGQIAFEQLLTAQKLVKKEEVQFVHH